MLARFRRQIMELCIFKWLRATSQCMQKYFHFGTLKPRKKQKPYFGDISRVMAARRRYIRTKVYSLKVICSKKCVRYYKSTRTAAFHQQSDEKIERLNRTVKNVLFKYISEHQNDTRINFLMELYSHITVQYMTGITPYRMVFGEEMWLPVDGKVNDDCLYTNNRKFFTELSNIVRNVTRNDAVRQKRYYDRNLHEIN